METATNSSIATMLEALSPRKVTPMATKRRSDPAECITELVGSFIPLELETRPTVSTAAAAHYLHLAQQTMRIYACKENGPLRPRRINGRLHWVTADIRKLLGVQQ